MRSLVVPSRSFAARSLSSTKTSASRLVFGLSMLAFLAAPAAGLRAEERLAADPAARELMHAAHDARAVWNNFPGYSAEISVRSDGVVHTGTITVGPDFEFKSTLPEKAVQPWVKAKLRSVISHRRPDPFTENGFAFIPEEGDAAAGKLVRELDGSGTFRIRDGVLAEVLRRDDAQWMEISNLDMLVTAEGKQLPRVTSVTFRDPKTGNVKSNLSNTFEWKRVGGFDLPSRTMTVEVGADGQRSVREISFRNIELAKPTK